MQVRKIHAVVGVIFLVSAANGVHADQNVNSSLLPSPAMDTDFYDNGNSPAVKILLGKKLYFDKILSGNLNISCATCHHALTDTGDGLSLPVGEGGRGLGMTRDTGSGADAIHERVPRNAPAVFNLGAREFTRMFDDGRVEKDPDSPSGFRTPAGAALPAGLENALAVQAMFPVTSETEMAGQAGENAQADAGAAGDLPLVWQIVAGKLRENDEYAALFESAYGIGRDEITFVLAANALAAFEASAFRSDNSPFDQYLRGDVDAMSPAAKRGMRVFYGKGGCARCHSGAFQTDQAFHAIAMPQIGPGKGNNSFPGTPGPDLEDFGRENVTGDIADRFRFRTPTLRNVTLTAPYGHAGAYNTLEAVVRHHLDPVNSLYQYDRNQAVLPSRPDLDAMDFAVMDDPARVDAIAAANELQPVQLADKQIADLMAFLQALTDPGAVDLRNEVPASVPSGFPLAE